jgi:hypothetical protein
MNRSLATKRLIVSLLAFGGTASVMLACARQPVAGPEESSGHEGATGKVSSALDDPDCLTDPGKEDMGLDVYGIQFPFVLPPFYNTGLTGAPIEYAKPVPGVCPDQAVYEIDKPGCDWPYEGCWDGGAQDNCTCAIYPNISFQDTIAADGGQVYPVNSTTCGWYTAELLVLLTSPGSGPPMSIGPAHATGVWHPSRDPSQNPNIVGTCSFDSWDNPAVTLIDQPERYAKISVVGEIYTTNKGRGASQPSQLTLQTWFGIQ